MLNLLWVKTFLGLVECRSFQETATRLGLAQPTVSQQIRKLEESLGVLLFHRARTGCEPTPAALALLPCAEGLLRLNERALAAVRGEPLRVGASSNIGIYLLPPHVRSFVGEGESSRFHLLIDRNPVIANKLEAAELDVAVMEWWDGRPRFKAERWKREPLVLIVPPSHAWAGRSEIDKQQLAGAELLGGEPGTGTGRLLQDYLGRTGISARVSLQLGSTEAVKRAVRAGLGISVVLASAVVEEALHGSLWAIPLREPPLSKELFIVWRDSGARHAPAPAFVQHLLAQA
jgi:DNA-binding transcriptional LysR family regulator